MQHRITSWRRMSLCPMGLQAPLQGVSLHGVFAPDRKAQCRHSLCLPASFDAKGQHTFFLASFACSLLSLVFAIDLWC